MNKALTWKILIPLGIGLFILGKIVGYDIELLGLFCLIYGILELIIPKQLEKLNNVLRLKGNSIAVFLLIIAVLVVLVYFVKK